MELQFGVGENWTFVTADIVALNASAITVPLPTGADPKALSGVRYAWGDNPCCGTSHTTCSDGEPTTT